MNEDGLTLSVYFGDSLAAGGGQLASDALMDCLARHNLTVAALFRGSKGFGIGGRIHTARFPDLSTDLPLLATATDARQRIEGLLDSVDGIVTRGLVTLEYARLVTDDDVARATFPTGPGRAAKLTIYCGRAERVGTQRAYRAVVDLLRRQGAAGATVLFGLDGIYHGRRARSRLLAWNQNAVMAVISVGQADVLQRVLPILPELLPRPVVNLESIAVVKHDGELLEPLPAVPTGTGEIPDMWQTVRIHTRKRTQFEGRPLYAEVTRRLRRAGAAGVTTIVGEWGFSSDEAPYGDRLGTLSSHLPTYTIFVDRPDKVAEVWPIIDEVTAEHGIVTSLLVPGYRERAGETVQGRLQADERALFPRQAGNDLPQRRLLVTAARGLPEPIGMGREPAEAQWLRALSREAAEFSRSRGRTVPIVRVTLADGEQFFLAAAESHPGGGFLTLHPHPRSHAELVPHAEGHLTVPRALVVPLGSIVKIELLTTPPRGTRSLVGFNVVPEE